MGPSLYLYHKGKVIRKWEPVSSWVQKGEEFTQGEVKGVSAEDIVEWTEEHIEKFEKKERKAQKKKEKTTKKGGPDNAEAKEASEKVEAAESSEKAEAEEGSEKVEAKESSEL